MKDQPTEYYYTITVRVASHDKEFLRADRQTRAQTTVDVLGTISPKLDYQFVVKEILPVPLEDERISRLKKYQYTLTAITMSDDINQLAREYAESVRISGLEDKDGLVNVITVSAITETGDISDEDGPQHEHLKGQDDA